MEFAIFIGVIWVLINPIVFLPNILVGFLIGKGELKPRWIAAASIVSAFAIIGYTGVVAKHSIFAVSFWATLFGCAAFTVPHFTIGRAIGSSFSKAGSERRRIFRNERQIAFRRAHNPNEN